MSRKIAAALGGSLIFMLAPSLARAANYFVSPTGNDFVSNRDPATQPFKTILRAMNVLRSGDVLTVEEGTYTEPMGEPTELDNSGAASWAEAITIKAREGKPVTLRPTGNFVFHFQSSKQIYIIVDGFTIDARNVAVDAVKIGYATPDNPTNISHHIWIKDCSISNAPLIGILITKADDNSYGGHNYFSNNDIFNNGLKCKSNPGFDWKHCHGIYAAADNNTIENSRLHGNTGLGLHSYSTDDPTKYHKIHHNIIRYSLAYDNGMLNGGFEGWEGIGLYSVFDSGPPHEAYGNIVWNNRRGFSLRYGGEKSIVHDNIIYLNTGPAGSPDPGYPIDLATAKTVDSTSSTDGVYGNTYVIADFPSPLPMSDTQKPSVPSVVQAVAVSMNQINLSWAASSDNVAVKGYRIYPSFGGPPIASVTGTTHQLTGLAANTLYGYYVDAFDIAGNYSAKSALMSVRTPVTNNPSGDTLSPSAPIGLRIP